MTTHASRRHRSCSASRSAAGARERVPVILPVLQEPPRCGTLRPPVDSPPRISGTSAPTTSCAAPPCHDACGGCDDAAATAPPLLDAHPIMDALQGSLRVLVNLTNRHSAGCRALLGASSVGMAAADGADMHLKPLATGSGGRQVLW